MCIRLPQIRLTEPSDITCDRFKQVCLPLKLHFYKKVILANPPRVEQFSLFINDEHFLGCHVRINNPTLSLGTKNPILLPAKHLFVDLLVQIKNVHEKVKQRSQQHTHHHTREILEFARKTDRQTCAKIYDILKIRRITLLLSQCARSSYMYLKILLSQTLAWTSQDHFVRT